MDLYIWQWVVRLLNKIKLGHGQKSLKSPALECLYCVSLQSVENFLWTAQDEMFCVEGTVWMIKLYVIH